MGSVLLTLLKWIQEDCSFYVSRFEICSILLGKNDKLQGFSFLLGSGELCACVLFWWRFRVRLAGDNQSTVSDWHRLYGSYGDFNLKFSNKKDWFIKLLFFLE